MRILRLIALLLFAVSAATAQGTLPLDRLPANTYAYVIWHGQPAMAKGQATNNLLRLWNDPEFLSTRKAFAEWFMAETAKPDKDAKEPPSPLTREEMDLFFEVLSNTTIIGAAGTPDVAAWFNPPKDPKQKSKESDFFGIWNSTGKVEQSKRLQELIQKRTKEKPVVTTLTFQGVTIKRSESSDDLVFDATVGPWEIGTGRQALMEELITRLQAQAAPPGGLTQSPFYLAAQRFRTENPVGEFFVKFPDLTKAKFPPSAGFDTGALLRGLHLERVHGLVGSLGLAGTGTRLRSALLGDTAPGSVFDLFGANVADFATLPLAPAGNSYSGMRLNLAALYQTVRAAVKGAMPPEQFANVEMVEGMVGSEVQMSVVDILGLVEELGVISPEDVVEVDLASSMFAVRIRRHEELLRLMRTTLASNITSESVDGDATVLALTAPYRDEKTGAQRSRFYYIAVTPQLMVVAPRRAMLRQALARAGGTGAQAGSLAADAGFQQNRALLPPALNSLAYSDMTKFPWQAFTAELDKQFQEQQKKDPSFKAPPPDALKSLPALLARYLHTATSGSWKDAGGIFFEVRID